MVNLSDESPHETSSKFSSKYSVRVHNKAAPDYSLTARDDKVVFALSDPSDPFQHWFKEENLGRRVKDVEGTSSFALVNKATNLAITHSFGANHPLQLIPYSPNVLIESILWTESKDLGDSFRNLRMVNNIALILDAGSGHFNDGTVAVPHLPNNRETQRWKITPYYDSSHEAGPVLSGKYSVRVHNKAGPDYSLTVRGDQVVFALSDPSDLFQHWFKDETVGRKVKDAEGTPSFALVNKATGLAITHLPGAKQPVQLIPHNQSVLNKSVLWTESENYGNSFKNLIMVENVNLILDAWCGVSDGSIAALHPPNGNDTQLWNITPYYDSTHEAGSMLSSKYSVRIHNKAGPDYSLTVRGDQVVFAQTNPSDLFQHWFKEETLGSRVNDAEGTPSFALVNEANGLAISHSPGVRQPLQLIPHNPYVVDESILWTESKDLGDSFRILRTVNDVSLVLDAWLGQVRDGTIVVPHPPQGGDNQRWKFTPHYDSIYKAGPVLSSKYSVRVHTKAGPKYSLTVRDDQVVFARSDPSDLFQHWFKDETWGRRVKDAEGNPSFVLVNKATGMAITHSPGATHPVQLIPYNPNILNEWILWTESKDLGDRFRNLRMANNIGLILETWGGDVGDGTGAALHPPNGRDNQRWKITPYYDSTYEVGPLFSIKCSFRVHTKAGPDYSLTVRGNRVVFASSDPSDLFQHWFKEETLGRSVKDAEGTPSFALVNKATDLVITHSPGIREPVQLMPHNPIALNKSILWTESKDLGDNFRKLRTVNNINLVLDVWQGRVHDGAVVVPHPPNDGDNQLWKITPHCDD